MKGLVITTDNLMRTEEYTAPLHESIGKTVGGWIEVVHPKLLPAPYCMIVNPEASAEENKTNMIHAMDNVKAGQVTYAVRNTSMNGFSIKQGDIIGLDDDDLKCLGALISAVSGGGVKWESEAR